MQASLFPSVHLVGSNAVSTDERNHFTKAFAYIIFKIYIKIDL